MKQHRVPLIAMVFVIAAFDARASGDRITQSNDNNTQTTGDVSVGTDVSVGGSTLTGGTQSMTSGDLVGGDVSVGGDKNRAYMLSHGMGDVDIGACYGSKHWSTPIVGNQGYTMLLVQCAERLDAMGLHLAAALMRCADDTYAGLFVSRTECLQLSTIPDDVSVPQPALGDDEDEDHKKYEAEIAALTEQLQQAQVQAKDAQRVAYNAKQKVQAIPAVSSEVQKEIDAYEQRRIKAKAALEGDK